VLENQDIIYFSNDWAADNKTSSHQIAQQLSKSNRLLYIEASGLRAPTTSAHDIKRIFNKIKKIFSGARKVSDNVHVYSPFIIPFHRYAFIKKINKFILVYSIKKTSKKLGFKKPILWIVIPHMSVVINNLDEKLVVYYCVDDFSSLPGVDTKAILEHDVTVTEKADVIFTPSQPLYEKKVKINNNTYLSPHGVNIDHFAKVFNKDLDIPVEMRDLDKPIIGFFGLIEQWIDLELIKYMAQANPRRSIVLIGRVVQDITGFNGIDNVYFLGARPYDLLPNYAKLFDVAVIPYKLNKQVYNANPIKLREYLAMGKPVVSVRSPEMEKFSDVIYISDNYEEFVNNIENALNNNTDIKVQERITKVKYSSWEKRLEKVSEIISKVLKNKEGENLR